ncbi:DUF1634 domain-containing protein [Chloroflexota bacterium]
MENQKFDDSRLNNWVSLGFRLGIAVSFALVIIGLIILLSLSGTKDIQPLVRLDIPAATVISVGILILLLTSIIQVILSIVFFSKARNRLFIGVSIAVFCLVAISLVLALI